MQPPTNPLIDDRDVELILDEVLDVARLFRLPYFAEHDRETVAMFIGAARDLARDVLFPAYRILDAEPPQLIDGRVRVHPRLRPLYAGLIELGVIAAPRPHAVGGSQVPLSVFALASVYLMAGNLSAYGYAGLTQGAAHLLEAFGDEHLRSTYMSRMYAGTWRLLELLTPIAKSFPAEKGFESNALAVQVHGGYGYSSEYLPEAWLRDQKLNQAKLATAQYWLFTELPRIDHLATLCGDAEDSYARLDPDWL